MRRVRDRLRRGVWPNRRVAKCPACGSVCWRSPRGWLWWADLVPWIVFCQLVVWAPHPPYLLGLVLVFALSMPWNAAVRRLYHGWWFRRHPLRCQGPGHLAPATEQS